MIGVIIKILKWESCLNNFDRKRNQYLTSFPNLLCSTDTIFFLKYLGVLFIFIPISYENDSMGDQKRGKAPPVRRLLGC